MNANCKFCGGKFFYEPVEGMPYDLTPTVCDPCDENQRTLAKVEAESERRRIFRTLCPPAFLETDPNHKGMPTAQRQAQILNWKYGPKGLVVHGQTRRGKSRLVWLLLKRLIVTDRKTVEPMSAIVFSNSSSWSWMNGPDVAADWRDRLVAADVLFIDDIGKEKLTERASADLFDVFDTRCSNLKPTIFTTNFLGDELPSRFCGDEDLRPDQQRGPAFVARMREFCMGVCV